jgi:hypothetical protein
MFQIRKLLSLIKIFNKHQYKKDMLLVEHLYLGKTGVKLIIHFNLSLCYILYIDDFYFLLLLLNEQSKDLSKQVKRYKSNLYLKVK